MKNFNFIEWLQTDSHGKQRVRGISALLSSRVWKHVAMIFAVLVMSIANIGMAWGATFTPAQIAASGGTTTNNIKVSTSLSAGTAKKCNTQSGVAAISLSSNANQNVNSNYIEIQATSGTITSLSLQARGNSDGSTGAMVIVFWSGDAQATYSSYSTSFNYLNRNGTDCDDAGYVTITVPSNTKTVRLYKGIYVKDGAFSNASGKTSVTAGGTYNIFGISALASTSCLAADLTAANITSNGDQVVGTGITFSKVGSPASGDTWYWQTSATGTDKTYNASSSYTTATTAGSYTVYLRAYNSASDCWGTAISKTNTIFCSNVYNGENVAKGSTTASGWTIYSSSSMAKTSGSSNGYSYWYQASSSSGDYVQFDGSASLVSGDKIIIKWTHTNGSNKTLTLTINGSSVSLTSGSTASNSVLTEAVYNVTSTTEVTSIKLNSTGSKGCIIYQVSIVKAVCGSSCTAPTASWSTAPANGTAGGNMNASLTTNYATGVVYSSSDPSVATVSGNGNTTCAITYVAAGTARITATVTGDGSTICVGPATCYTDITVSAPEPSCGETAQAALTLSSNSGTICGTGTATFTVSGGSGTGELSVSSSDETKATASIEGSTVTVTGVAAGSATITVTKACDATYAEKTATYEVTVAAVPTANAGADKTTESGTGVALAATAAADGCTGAWTIVSGPNTATSQLSSTSSATATFTPTAAGTYTLRWTVTNSTSGCSSYDEMTVKAAICSISDCGNATLTYPLNVGTSLVNTAANLVNTPSNGGSAALTVPAASAAVTLSTITISETDGKNSNYGKAAAATNACYPTAPTMSSEIGMYNGSSYSSSNYLQFAFTVNSGYTFTPCDIQFTVQPVSNEASFRWEVTDGTNIYGYGTGNAPVGSGNGATVLTGLTSTSEMEAGDYYIRLYPYYNGSNTFRISNNVILKGTTEEVVASKTVYLKNTMGWANAYLNFYRASYWDESNGAGNSTESASYISGPIAMSYDSETGMFYYETDDDDELAATIVSFTKDNQSNYGNFNGTEAIYSFSAFAFDKAFVPVTLSNTYTKNNGNTKYYTYTVENVDDDWTGYYLWASGQSWEPKDHEFTDNGDGTLTFTKSLSESTKYQFKINEHNNAWGSETFVIQPISDRTFASDAAACALYTGPAGEYTFTINTTTKAVSVSYPSVTHPVAGYAYFKKWNDWAGYYVHWWNGSTVLTTWGSDPQITTDAVTICSTDYVYFPILSDFPSLKVKDNAGEASHYTGDLSSTGSSGKYFDFTNNNAWNTFGHKVSYDANKGSGTMDDSQAPCNSVTLSKCTFTRTGWTFIGWNTNKYGGGTSYEDEETIADLSSDLTLYAQWERTIYLRTENSEWWGANAKLTIHYWDGSATSNSDDVELTRADNCSDPRVYKATISGGGYNKLLFYRLNPANDAVWTQTVDLDFNDTYDMYNLTNMSGGTDNKAYGTFSSSYSAPTYTISFNAGGGSSSMSDIENIACEGNQTIPANGFTRTGYSFTGWTANVDVTVNSATVEAGSAIADEATIQNISSDITLTAQWTAETYDVTTSLTNVEVSSGTTGDDAATYGTAYSVTLASETGYNLPTSVTVTIGGETANVTDDYTWNSSTGVLTVLAASVTGDINITATGVIKTYSITYDNGAYGTGTISGGTKTHGEAYTLSSSTFTRDGYVQTGWSLTDGGSKAYELGGSYTTNAAQTFYPFWTVTYAVTFNSNGGSAVATQYIASGNTASEPSNPTRTNWTFEGWQLEGEDYSFSTAVTGAITLDAVWSRNTIGNRDITEIYSADEENESGVTSASSYNGTSFSLKKIDDKSWDIAKDYSSATGDGKTFNYAFLPGNSSSDTQGFQLTAKKSISSLVVYYTLTDSKFTSKDQSKSGSLTYKINTNDAVVLSSVDGSNKVAYKGTVSTIAKDDVVKLYSSANRLAIFALYATYSGNPLYVKTTVNGVKRDSITFTSGETLGNLFDDGELPTISITGYTFNGWKNAAADTTVTKSTVLTADMTIYADLTPEEYDITLDKGTNGSTDGEGTVEMGAGSLTITTAPTASSGYALKGYYTDTEANEGVKVAEEDGTLVEGNVTGYVTSGKWSKSSATTLYAWWGSEYDVRFFQGYGTPDTQIGETQTIASGEPATAPADPERDHYEFAGWKTGEEDPMTKAEVDAYSITEATDFVAQWTPLYSITEGSHTNGSIAIKKGDDDVTEAKEGTTITLTATPNFKYVLDSWSVTYVDEEEEEQEVTVTDNQFTMPAYDVTVSATFNADSRKQILYLTTGSDTETTDSLYKALSEVDSYKIHVETPSSQTVTNYDLVVLHESLDGKTYYNHAVVAAAKSGNVPVLNTKSYFYTSDRWNWGTADAGKSIKGARLNTDYSNIKDHPIFDGLTFADTDSMTLIKTAAAKAMQPLSAFVSGKEGYTLATTPLSSGWANRGCAIHELTPAQRGVASAKYLLISVSSGKLGDLSDDGKKLFKNAAAYLLDGSAQWVPQMLVAEDASSWGEAFATAPTLEVDVTLGGGEGDPITITIANGETAKAKSITLNNAKLNIQAGGALIVANSISKDGSATAAGDIHLGSDAEHGNAALVMGNYDGTNAASVDFYTKARKTAENNWVNQYIGTPFRDDEGGRGVKEDYYGSYLYSFDFDTQSWDNIKDEDYHFTPFLGYNIIRKDADAATLEMQGTLVATTNQSLTLSYDKDNAHNENVLANSWTAPIKIKAFEESDFTNSTASIYIFNAGGDADAKAGGTAGNYSTYSIGTAEDGDVIPSMQSFSVYATAASPALTLNYARLVYNPAVTGIAVQPNYAPRRMKAAAVSEEMQPIRLRVSGESGYADELKIYLHEDFSDAFENGWDAHKMYGYPETPQLYAVTDDGELAILCAPDADATLLGFKAGEADTEYTFTFRYDSDEQLFLLDMQNNTYTEVQTGNAYTFQTSDVGAHNRFVLTRFAPQMPTDIEPTSDSSLKGRERGLKFIEGEKMFILMNGVLYDATGKRVRVTNERVNE